MKRLPVNYIAAFLLLALFNAWACKPKKLENGRAIAVEVEMRTVKRFTEKQILAEAIRVGDSLSGLADSLARHRLTEALRRGGVQEALQHYPPEAYAEVQTMARHYGARPARQGQQQEPASKAASARMLSNTELLYTRPIYLHASCLSCHGPDISAADAGLLQARKQLWGPRGLQEGDLAGTWYIPLQRKAILNGLTLKDMKKKPGPR
ncbi:MAG: c-type heme family protein [Adhaeribacter sp.]